MLSKIWNKIWQDKHGKVVIWQMPNVPLIGWAGLTFLSLLFSGRTANFFSWVASVALIYWSFLEIFKGANYFRRGLGLVVLFFSLATVIKSF